MLSAVNVHLQYKMLYLKVSMKALTEISLSPDFYSFHPAVIAIKMTGACDFVTLDYC